MSHPREKFLADATDRLCEVRWGLAAFLERLREMEDGGYPGSGTGGGGTGLSKPTENGLNWGTGEKDDRTRFPSRKPDPGRVELRQFDRDVETAFKAVQNIHARYRRLVEPAHSPARMEDPGCELCDEIPDHWCPTFIVTEVEIAHKRKTERKRLRLCEWCYRRRNLTQQLPNKDERTAHAKGLRVPIRKP